jgi:hypothetical protein
MGNLLRYQFAAGTTVACLGFAALYEEAFKAADIGLYNQAVNEHAGPFSGIVVTIDNLYPIAVTIILFVVWGYALVGGVQEERAVRRGGPR